MSMKSLALAFSTLAAAFALADVSVENITCTQRYPWNGLVDIEYDIACDDPDAEIYVNPVVYDGDRRITLFPSHFTGDGATNTVKAGKHTITWDAKADLGAFSSANFQVKICAGKRLPRYVVIDISSGAESANFPVRFSIEGPDLSDDTCRTTEIWLRLVPPGEFWMGSPADELGREDDEDLHHVTLTKPFYMAIFETTIKQWELVCGEPPAYFNSSTNRDVRPVECVHYNYNEGKNTTIRGQYNPLSNDLSGNGFLPSLRSKAHNGGIDLPSETRWEYACRAGTMTALYTGSNLDNESVSGELAKIAAYRGNRYPEIGINGEMVEYGTAKVGSYAPNALGLYDMLGNCWEFCRDGANNNIHKGYTDVVDPKPNSDYKSSAPTAYYYLYARRGGSWGSHAKSCRAAERIHAYNGSHEGDYGFRICAEAGF